MTLPAGSPIAGRFTAMRPWAKGAMLVGATLLVGAVGFYLVSPSSTPEDHHPAQQVNGGEIGQPFHPLEYAQPPVQQSSQQPATTGLPTLATQGVQQIAMPGLAQPRPQIRPSPIDAYSAQLQQNGGQNVAAEEARRAAARGQDAYAAPDFQATEVTELPDPDWIVEQGTQIPCIQQTKLNTTFGGPISAIIPVNVRGSTGRVTVINSGSRIFGTIEKGIINGLDRAFVLWRQITTPPIYDDAGLPHVYRVRIDSPAADELGQTGLDGEVNQHLLKKFGGVLALSLIQVGGETVTNLSQPRNNNSNGSPTINLNNVTGNSEQLATTLLQSTLQIPDVLTRNQGQSCTIFLARDLNMKGAFHLERNTHR